MHILEFFNSCSEKKDSVELSLKGSSRSCTLMEIRSYRRLHEAINDSLKVD